LLAVIFHSIQTALAQTLADTTGVDLEIFRSLTGSKTGIQERHVVGDRLCEWVRTPSSLPSLSRQTYRLKGVDLASRQRVRTTGALRRTGAKRLVFEQMP